MENSLFSDLLLITDSNVSSFCPITVPAFRISLLILLASLALMLLPQQTTEKSMALAIRLVEDLQHLALKGLSLIYSPHLL